MKRFISFLLKSLAVIVIVTLGLLAIPDIAVAQTADRNMTVTGQITGYDGQPLAGASVFVKGTNNGVVSDINGLYSINVAGINNPVLIYSFIGCESVEKKAKGGQVIDVILQNDSEYLEEVVVIGYGVARKKDLTGSVANISAETLKDVPTATVAEALTGRLPGVQITTTEGNPDAEIQIRVRGGGSISQDNSPLYIIDGFPSDDGLSNINPADIEYIDVLKDASSTAIYGARGANGVIVITTKKGSSGKPKISYEGYYGVRRVSKFLDVLTPYEYVMAQHEIANLPSAGSTAPTNFINKYGEFSELEKYRDREGINWQEEVFGRKAVTHNHNFSISGGNANSKYSVRYGHYSEEGVMLESSVARDNFKASFDQKVNDKLKFSVSTSYSHKTVLGSDFSGKLTNGSLGNTITYRPVMGLNDDDAGLITETEDDSGSEYLTNPIVRAQAQHQKKTYSSLLINGNIEYQIFKDLTLTVSGGYSTRTNRTDLFYDERLRDVQLLGGPYGSIKTVQNEKLTETAFLTYSKKLKKHFLSAMAGQEIVKSRSEMVTAGAHEFPNSDIGLANLGLGASPDSPTSLFEEDRLASFFGRVMYNYDDRYLLTANFRADGSSKFAPDNQWGYFPSASVAWRASEETFIKNLDVFSNLKFRASYGLSGNNRIGNNLYASTFSSTYYAASGTSHSIAIYPTTLASPDLKWETTKSLDIGMDIGFFDGRLNAVVDLYNNTTVDLLMKASIPSSTGYTYQYKNVGSTQNRGIEIGINVIPVERKNFTWISDFNISFNQGKILSLNGEEDSYIEDSGWAKTINDFLVQVGQPVGVIYGYVTDGFYTADDFVGYDSENNKWILKDGVPYIKGESNISPGDLKFKRLGNEVDENGNPVITADTDRTILGKTSPKFTGGWNNTFRFYGFDLSIFLNFVYGNKVLNANKIAYTNTYSPYRNFLGVMADRFRLVNNEGVYVTDLTELAELNKDAKIWRVKDGELPRFVHSWAVEDASFLRINNVTLGYTLPKKVTEKIKIQALRVYCTVNNLHVFTNYTGYDPEVSAMRSNPLTPGVDYSAYPKSKAVIMGLNITF